MKTSILILLLAVTILLSSSTSAKDGLPLSARGLYEACKHTIEKLEEGPEAMADVKRVNTCMFYVMGAADMAASMSPSPIYGGQICAPTEYIFQTLARKIVALGVQYDTLFTDAAPARLLTYYAIKETYGSDQPCPKASGPSSE